MNDIKAMSNSNFSIKVTPLALVLLVVPLIVFFKLINLEGVLYDFWTGTKEYADFFSYYKFVWLSIFTVASGIFALYYLYYKKVSIKFSTFYIPLAAYAILVLLSTVFSDYKDISMSGFTDRYEGLLTIFCYIILCLITSFLVTNLSDIKFLYICLFISVFIISLLGISQFFGFDFFQTHFGKLLILPKENSYMVDTLKFNFPKNYIYSTMYNPNYVGSYFAMIFPISILFFIFSKNIKQRFLTGLISTLSFISFLGCLSSAGYVGALFTLLVLGVLLRKIIIKNIFPLLCLTCIFVGFSFIMNYASSGAILSQIGLSSTVVKQPKVNKITDININGSKMTLVVKNATSTNVANSSLDVNKIPLYVYCSEKDQNLQFKNIEGGFVNILKDTKDQGTYLLGDPRYEGISFSLQNNMIRFKAPNTQFDIMIENNDFIFLNNFGKPTKLITADSIGFQGRERMGSSRGYIWSRSLPLLNNTILLGHGPDTFAMYFPQNDYISKLNYLDSMFILVDKPHNLYLQTAINTGMISLIAFLVFICMYLVSSLKLYFKAKVSNEYYISGIASFIAVIGFLVASLFNDSVISVSPVFWILLGLGIACNRLYSHSMKKI